MQLNLPAPSADALSASHALQARINDEIDAHAGWISFSRYMELVLYTPQLGYYSGGAAKLGRDGDFTTAPEITPFFGATVAQAIADLIDAGAAPSIMEFGAGTGKLARDVLDELARLGVDIDQYAIVELSGELRQRQQSRLQDYPQAVWLDRIPAHFSGIVLGNEVLDAMPVHLVVKTEHGWSERGVIRTESGVAFADRPCDSQLIEQIPFAEQLPQGFLTEVHPIAIGFMQSVASMLANGKRQTGADAAAIFIDYGFPAHEYYLPQRDQGTLMCHYRHHAHPDPFYLPGLQDITAHVDFTAMARTAITAGLEVLAYNGQAGFLMNAGIAERLLRTSPENAAQYLPQANAVQRLTSPAEMGELFKVLIVGTGVSLPTRYLRGDRSHRL